MTDYVTLAAFKDAIKYTAADRDAEFSRCISAASRLFDRLTRRDDDAFVATTATKRFSATDGGHLWVPCLLAVTALKTDHDGDGVYETTWSASDYLLHPLDDPPFRRLDVNRATGRYSFPLGQAKVQLEGSWGYSGAAPADVARAVVILANRLANRPKTPEGMMGTSDTGFVTLRNLDPDVQAIAERYVDVEAMLA